MWSSNIIHSDNQSGCGDGWIVDDIAVKVTFEVVASSALRLFLPSAREQFYWAQPGVNFSGLVEDYSKEREYDFENDVATGSAEDGVVLSSAVVKDEKEERAHEDQSTSASSTIPSGGRDAEGRILDPPETFLLLLVYPQEVRYLRLGDNFSCRHVLVDGNWVAQRENP